ncbi:MAG: hypothetical protein ACXW2P_01870 [Thermoanaerobaculia bacterium]
MTTMTHPAARFADRHHHPATTATLVLLFWVIAAVLVFASHNGIEPRWPKAGTVATIGSLLVTAYAYSRLVAREAGVPHALGVGIAWLALSIVVEISMTSVVGHGWFGLLGSPERPLVRNILLFVWIFSPALFARRASQ